MPTILLYRAAGGSQGQYPTHLEHPQPINLLGGPYPSMEPGYNKTRIKNFLKKSIIRGNESAIKLEQIFLNPACSSSVSKCQD